MQDLDLKSLRLLVAVCDAGNIKLAALQEHIEPSAISKRIAQLEARLGTALLLRGRRGVQPTPAGSVLLEHARTLRFTLDRIEADVTAFRDGLKGHVRLAASASAVAESLLDDVAEFMRNPGHQGIKVDIEERVSTDVIRLVRDGRASLGLCWDHIDMPGLQQQPYRADRLALAVHVSHPLAARKTIRFAQTLEDDHVSLSPSTAVHAMLTRAAAKAGRAMNCRIIVSNFDAALRVVAANLGISVIPLEVSRHHADHGTIKLIPLSDTWAKRRFAVCYRDKASLTPAALRMLGFLERKAAE